MIDFDFHEEVADFEMQHRRLDSQQLTLALQQSTVLSEQVALCNLLSIADYGVWETDENCLSAMRSTLDLMQLLMKHRDSKLSGAARDCWLEIDEIYDNLQAELEAKNVLQWFVRR